MASSGARAVEGQGQAQTALCEEIISAWAARLCLSQAPEAFQQLRGIGYVAARLVGSDALQAAVDRAETKPQLCAAFSAALGGRSLSVRAAEAEMDSPWVDPMSREWLSGEVVIPLSGRHHRDGAGAAMENVSVFNADTLARMGRGRRATGFRVDPMATRRSTQVRDMVADYRGLLGLGRDEDVPSASSASSASCSSSSSSSCDGGKESDDDHGDEGHARRMAEARALHEARVADMRKRAAAHRKDASVVSKTGAGGGSGQQRGKRIRVAFLPDGDDAAATAAADPVPVPSSDCSDDISSVEHHQVKHCRR